MILCTVSVVVSHFSFLILLILILSLFFLMSLAKGLSVWLIFSQRTNFYLYWSLLLFFSFIFHLFLLWSLWFLSANFGTLCSFSSCFRCKFTLFIWDICCFLRWDCTAINFRLWTAFAVSHRFWVVVFSLFICFYVFFISSLISSGISGE